jgi:hypothetical protein
MDAGDHAREVAAYRQIASWVCISGFQSREKLCAIADKGLFCDWADDGIA